MIGDSSILFEFATAARIVFGNGCLSQVGKIARSFGSRALIVTGQSSQRAAPLIAYLTKDSISVELYSLSTEPSISMVRQSAQRAKDFRSDVVIGFGGGSAIDGAKATAALAANEGDPMDYLEVVGRALPLAKPSIPFIAIPTTAGTGAEVTRNAVLSCPEHQVKASLRNPGMLARVALIDPELTCSMPPHVTAASGLDALTQLIEPFTCTRANPLTDSFCREGLKRAAASLRLAWENGQDLGARESMSLASLLSGLALANAGLGAVHGLAAAIGGMHEVPHGAICAALLPHVMATNVEVLATGDSPALARYEETARILTGQPNASVQDGIAWVTELCLHLRIPSLAHWGITPDSFPSIVSKALAASSMKANPARLSDTQVEAILRRGVE